MILQDLKYACRSILRRPGFSAVVVVTLALGIGANATIFSWIDALLYNPIPGIADASALVAIHPTTATRRDLSISYPDYQDVRDSHPDGFTGITAFRYLALGMRVASGEPERCWAEIVTGNYFDVLGLRPALGRLLTADDDGAEGAGTVVVLSDRFWRTRFAARADVIGTSVGINGHPFTVIGVAPPEFKGAANGLASDVWLPMSMQRAVIAGARLSARGNGWLFAIGRLAPGASWARAQTSLSAVARRLGEAYPTDKDRGLAMSRLADEGAGQALGPVMSVVMGVVGIVLVIACVNIASLMLARGASRRREVAVRLAIGASRWQIIRALLIESFVLALAGGVLGLVMASVSTGMLGALLPPLPYQVLIPSRVSPRVILLALAAVGFSTLIFGLMPALQTSRPSLVPALRDGGGAIGTANRTRLRRALVVSQIALAMVLLVGAGLFARTLVNARDVDPGFDERHAVLASIDLAAAGYTEQTGQVFYRDLISRLEALPGVRRAGITTQLPLSLVGSSDTVPKIEGYEPAKNEDVVIFYGIVSPHYFDAMRLPILSGRAIGDDDVADKPLVVVINQTMARRYFKGRDALGGRIDYGSGWATVVGIAKDGKYGSIAEAPRSFMYLPVAQTYRPTPTLVVATNGQPEAALPEIRKQVAALNQNLPLFEIRTLADHLDASAFLPQLASMLLGAFGGLALVLSVIGLYGVIAFSVATRRREIGVRMALGAERSRIRRDVLAQGVRLALVGLAVGLLLSVLVAPLLASQLIGVRPIDATVLGVTSLLLLVVAGLASWMPAWRAARIEPIEALRER